MASQIYTPVVTHINAHTQPKEKIGVLRHIKKTWNTYYLLWLIKRQRRQFAAGKGVELKSLKDLR